MDVQEYGSWVGKKVVKRSKKPFKSTFTVATVTGIVAHPYQPWKLAFTFAEDNSHVECAKCKLVSVSGN